MSTKKPKTVIDAKSDYRLLNEKVISAFPAQNNLRAVFENEDGSVFLDPIIAIVIKEGTFQGGNIWVMDAVLEDGLNIGECSNFRGYQFIEPEKPLSEVLSERFEKIESGPMDFRELVLNEARTSLGQMIQIANDIVGRVLSHGGLDEETGRDFKTAVIDGMMEFRNAAGYLNKVGNGHGE
ncbi:hypothetical protein [Methylomagnum sp.]